MLHKYEMIHYNSKPELKGTKNVSEVRSEVAPLNSSEINVQ